MPFATARCVRLRRRTIIFHLANAFSGDVEKKSRKRRVFEYGKEGPSLSSRSLSSPRKDEVGTRRDAETLLVFFASSLSHLRNQEVKQAMRANAFSMRPTSQVFAFASLPISSLASTPVFFILFCFYLLRIPSTCIHILLLRLRLSSLTCSQEETRCAIGI